MEILLAEDDPAIAVSLQKNFLAEGHHMTVAADGSEALRLAESVEFDVIVLDWRMPGLTGLDVCRQLRIRGVTSPILMLTVLSDVDRKVEAFEAGADDFLTKPFVFRELMARVRAVRRRYDLPTQEIAFDRLRLSLFDRTVAGSAGSVELTDREFDLLRHFLLHRGTIQSREDLCRAVWRIPYDRASNVIEVTVRNLRKKLARLSDRNLIRSSYGEGYVFVAE